MSYFSVHVMAEAVLRWVLPGMLSFEPRPTHVEFMVDRVSYEQNFLGVRRFRSSVITAQILLEHECKN